MATYLTKQARCPICGKEFTVQIPGSYTIYGEMRELDGNTHTPEVYEMVSRCPLCGYVCGDFDERLDWRVPETLKSEEYQRILKDENIPENGKKAYLAALLAEKKEDPHTAGIWYLRAYWAVRGAEGQERFSEEARDKAIGMIQESLKKEPDLNAAMVLVDLLRQKGEFGEAREAVVALEKFLGNDLNLVKVAAFERGLIAAGDDRPHLLSEVLK